MIFKLQLLSFMDYDTARDFYNLKKRIFRY